MKEPSALSVKGQLARIMANGDFDASPRSRAFLCYIVEETLAGRQDGLTQSAIATRVFGRREDFDPTIDPIVRIQAGRLRRSLERYYLLAGSGDPVLIELPRGAYVPVLRPGDSEKAKGTDPAEAAGGPVKSAGNGWPSVLVEVPDEGPPGPEADQAAVRFQEALALELGRYGDVHVVLRSGAEREGEARGGDERFALSIRLSREDEGAQVRARLVDRGSGRQVWADQYEASSGPWRPFFEDVARVIAGRVGSEQGIVAQHLWAEQRTQAPGELTPYHAVLLCYQFLFNRQASEFAPAVEALRQAVMREPECGLVWSLLARLYTVNHAFEIAPLPTPIDDAIEFAQNGLRLEPSSPRARVMLGAAFFYKNELAAARAELQKTLDLNRDSFVYLEWIGLLLTLMGEWNQGPALVRRAIAVNRHHNPVSEMALWADALHRGEVEEAYAAAQRLGDAIFFWRPLMRACCLGHLGRRQEAEATVADLVRRKPEFAERGRALIGRVAKSPELFDRVVEGLARAGLALD